MISIITPVKNGAKYISQCIESVMRQDNIEHVIVDGVSNDGTQGIVRDYQEKYPHKIKFISEPDKSVGEAWNKGIGISSGDILGWIGADDILAKDASKIIHSFFAEHPQVMFAYGECAIMNESGQIYKYMPSRDFDYIEIVQESCYVPTPSSFYKRELLNKIGLYRNDGNDFEFLLRASRNVEIWHIHSVLSQFRVHSGSVSTGSNPKSRLKWLKSDYLVSRQYGGSIFNGYAKRYYSSLLVEIARPIFGWAYPAINGQR